MTPRDFVFAFLLLFWAIFLVYALCELYGASFLCKGSKNNAGIRCPVKDDEWPEWAMYCTISKMGCLHFWHTKPKYQYSVWVPTDEKDRYNYTVDDFNIKGSKKHIWQRPDIITDLK